MWDSSALSFHICCRIPPSFYIIPIIRSKIFNLCFLLLKSTDLFYDGIAATVFCRSVGWMVRLIRLTEINAYQLARLNLTAIVRLLDDPNVSVSYYDNTGGICWNGSLLQYLIKTSNVGAFDIMLRNPKVRIRREAICEAQMSDVPYLRNKTLFPCQDDAAEFDNPAKFDGPDINLEGLNYGEQELYLESLHTFSDSHDALFREGYDTYFRRGIFPRRLETAGVNDVIDLIKTYLKTYPESSGEKDLNQGRLLKRLWVWEAAGLWIGMTMSKLWSLLYTS